MAEIIERELAITLPLNAVESILLLAMLAEEPTQWDRQAIKLVEREIEQVRKLSAGSPPAP